MIEFEGKTLQLWIFSKRVWENMCEYIDSVNQKEKHPPLDSKVIFQVTLEEVLLRHQQQEESVYPLYFRLPNYKSLDDTKGGFVKSRES